MTDTRLALCDVRGSLNDLTDKLSGVEGASWLSGLNKFLRKENPWGEDATEPLEAAIYPIAFVPGLTWKKRIEACDFPYVDPKIWENIHRFIEIENEDSAPVDIGLDRFRKFMSIAQVESFQAAHGKEMISPARFLHLCEKHHDLRSKVRLICLKKICVDEQGRERILCVEDDDGDSTPGLHLYFREGPACESGYDLGYRFPFFRNAS